MIKKTAEELDREIAGALYGEPLPATPRGAAPLWNPQGVDSDAGHPDDDRFDREWKRQARKGKTDSFGSAEYRRIKSDWIDWIANGRVTKAIADFIPGSTFR